MRSGLYTNSLVLGLRALKFSFSFLQYQRPKPLISTFEPLFRASTILEEKISITFSITELLSFGFFFFFFFFSFSLVNYFYFFSFLPIAFSKIPLSVAPDLVAPSPNFAIKDFSSSI